MPVIEHHELRDYLPHRHPFLLIDRIVEVVPFERAVGVKNITGSEYFFPGHFPEKPVMPGVLMVEALAQTACVLATSSTDDAKGKIIYFAAIDNCRFKRQVVPGDQLRLEVTVDKQKKRLWKVRGIASVNGEVAVEADLTAMVAGE
ncbi:MAG: 3-hydroxyacyl-ACP dehydratase FabZ [Nitrospinae bacterium]|nr:3-hydroxyacyl-ACP dehydratase FabZ [Nitrospinota bacterium]